MRKATATVTRKKDKERAPSQGKGEPQNKNGGRHEATMTKSTLLRSNIFKPPQSNHSAYNTPPAPPNSPLISFIATINIFFKIALFYNRLSIQMFVIKSEFLRIYTCFRNTAFLDVYISPNFLFISFHFAWIKVHFDLKNCSELNFSIFNYLSYFF